MKSFYKSFETWELAVVQRDISGVNASGSTMAGVQPATMYRMLFNSTIFADSAIQTALRVAFNRVDGFPKDVVPPGVLLLLFHKDPVVRQKAQSLATQATVVPIPKEQFVGMYKDVLASIVERLSFDPLSNPQSRFPSFEFSPNRRDLWQSLPKLLRHVHPELLKSRDNSIDIRHVVVGHLHDSGAGMLFPFVPVLSD